MFRRNGFIRLVLIGKTFQVPYAWLLRRIQANARLLKILLTYSPGLIRLFKSFRNGLKYHVRIGKCTLTKDSAMDPHRFICYDSKVCKKKYR